MKTTKSIRRLLLVTILLMVAMIAAINVRAKIRQEKVVAAIEKLGAQSRLTRRF